MCQICGNPRSKHLRHWTEVENHDRFNIETKVPCSSCKGMKVINGERCQPCDGTGEIGIDMMPDGIHAKMYKFWDFNKSNMNVNRSKKGGDRQRPQESREERDAVTLKLMEDWKVLPEPKPDFFEWGADQCKPEMLAMLRDTAINGRLMSDRVKAADVLLKHGKIPPKQTIKLEGKDENIDVNDLLAKICELMKIPVDEPVVLRTFLTAGVVQ